MPQTQQFNTIIILIIYSTSFNVVIEFEEYTSTARTTISSSFYISLAYVETGTNELQAVK